MTRSRLRKGQRGRRTAQVIGAGALLAVAGIGWAGPVSAAENTFEGQWADAAWSVSHGADTWNVTMAAGKENDRGVVTEYLTTQVTARYCQGGSIVEVSLFGEEQGVDLSGVDVQALSGRATVSRTTFLPGLLTTTPSDDCVSSTGAAISVPMSGRVNLRGTWSNVGDAIEYSGSDCGGTGQCTYFDAKARGSVRMLGHTFRLGETTTAFLWNGFYDLSA